MRSSSLRAGRRSLAALALMLPAVVLGCERPERPRPAVVRTATGIFVTRPLLDVAEERGVNYLRHLSAAESGERDDLAALLAFTPGLSGEALRSHGVVLLELLARAGDIAFAELCGGLPEAQPIIRRALEVGGSNAPRAPLRAPLAKAFPATAAVLNRGAAL